MASNYPFDETPARRPSLADLGGAAKRDDTQYPPDPVTMPTAQNWNCFARELEGLAKLIPFCVIQVNFDAGAPFIQSLTSMRSTLTAEQLTITDNGNGDTTISWAAIPTAFPAPWRPPRADLIGDVSSLVPTCDTTTPNTVRVKTRNSASSLVDQPFVVEIF